MNEKEAEAQYEIISKMSLSEIVELLRRGCDNPVNSRNLREGDTVVYGGSFEDKVIKRRLEVVEKYQYNDGLSPDSKFMKLELDGAGPSFDCFIVRKIRKDHYVMEDEYEEKLKRMQYWMYRIRFVSNNRFKRVYLRDVVGDRTKMMRRIDRPTIVFNINTGKKWICDWMHPKEYGQDSSIKSPPLRRGTASMFSSSRQIVIITPNTISDKFLNWNSNPFEVKR